ncbi:conserved hypothetical protein TIGR00252 [Pseudoalteromonas luteoviolacea B = ATCC 29581]|nr:conserved hypothetical protein TIGR00252 [Pseudoalteromonas luteoviolacea B = ATCC 29581]
MTKWISWFKNTKQKGAHFESVAQHYLMQNGLLPICRNFNCRYGEIDLIMQEGDTIVFVEVKYRNQNRFGGAINSLSATKLQRLRKSIAYYCQQYPNGNKPIRIDFVAVEGRNDIHWIKNIY